MSDTNRPYGDDCPQQERARKFIAGIPYAHTHSVTGCRACAREMAEIARLRMIERAARSLMERVDFWRQAAGRGAAVIPGEYDNLVDALAAAPDAPEATTCERCDGTGKRPIYSAGEEMVADFSPCPACGAKVHRLDCDLDEDCSCSK